MKQTAQLGQVEPELEESPEQASQAQDPGMVALEEASNEDVDAALKAALDDETEQGSEPEQAAGPGEQAPQNGGQRDPQANLRQQQPNLGANAAPQPGANPSTPRVYSEAEVQGLLAEREKLRKESSSKELFIQHRGNEVGRLRQQLNQEIQSKAQVRQALYAGLAEKFDSNPAEAIEDRDRIKAIDSELNDLTIRDQQIQERFRNESFFFRWVDTEKVAVQDLAEVLRRDGMGDEAASHFMRDPFSFTTGEALVQLGRRAMDFKEHQQAYTDRKVLADYILKQEEIIKSLKSSQGSVVRQIQSNLRKPPSINGNAPAPAPRQSHVNLDVTRLSDAELNSALENSLR